MFHAWGMAYSVRLSYDCVGDHSQFPWIRPTDMIKKLGTTGDLRMLLAGCHSMAEAKPLLEEFWHRYKCIYPNHGLFRRIRDSGGRLSTSSCLPIQVHGDEGTTYKKNGVLVIQFSGIFGYGSRKTMADEQWEDWQRDVKSCGIPLNHIKTALQTRFLSFLCPRDWVAEN